LCCRYFGAWTADPTTLSNGYFQTLLNENWDEFKVQSTNKSQFKAADKHLYMLTTDLMLRHDPRFAAHVQAPVLQSPLLCCSRVVFVHFCGEWDAEGWRDV
jgi:hypothetical protein